MPCNRETLWSRSLSWRSTASLETPSWPLREAATAVAAAAGSILLLGHRQKRRGAVVLRDAVDIRMCRLRANR